jgi:hypothetical protein
MTTYIAGPERKPLRFETEAEETAVMAARLRSHLISLRCDGVPAAGQAGTP